MIKETETEPMADLEKALQLAIAHLDKQYGKGSVIQLGSDNINPWPSIPTGSPILDKALGIGGLPIGRIVEIYGPEGSGKSTLCLSILANAQKIGGKCLYVDAEHAVDPQYAQSIGVDMDALLFAQPSYGEEALEILDMMIGTGAIAVAVIDSVAALVPKAELDGDMEAMQMGLQARLMSKAMRKIVAKANENKTLVVFTNQLREKIGVMYGNPEVTSGGKALKFAASVRIDLRKKEDLKDKDTGYVIGSKVQAKVIKNKMAPPLRIAMFDILYGEGVDALGSLIDMALDADVLFYAGAWIKWREDNESFAQGREKAVDRLKVEPETVKLLREKLEC